MTDLTTYFKTDLVDDHVADDVNVLIGAVLRAEFSNTETISATKTLTNTDCQIQKLTASGASRDVRLPLAATSNHYFAIYNAGGSNNVVVKDSTGVTTYITLAPSEWGMLVSSGTGWAVLGSSSLAGWAAKAVPSGVVVGDTDTQTLTNKTLTTPTIGSFTNATHNHSSAATGGAINRGVLLNAFLGGNLAPADATTYYFGLPGMLPLTATAGQRKVFIPIAGTITRVDITVTNNSGTVGSSETSSIYIRLNNTTDTLLTSTLTANSAAGNCNFFNVTGLSIAVSAGDYIEGKWVTPSWATNPTNVLINVNIYITT
jgi:hypothetical protein